MQETISCRIRHNQIAGCSIHCKRAGAKKLTVALTRVGVRRTTSTTNDIARANPRECHNCSGRVHLENYVIARVANPNVTARLSRDKCRCVKRPGIEDTARDGARAGQG